MRNSTFSNKSNKYIYTEADLGEGLLDEGVTYPYQLDTIEQNHTLNYDIALIKTTQSIKPGVPNVQDDFSYTYYC